MSDNYVGRFEMRHTDPALVHRSEHETRFEVWHDDHLCSLDETSQETDYETEDVMIWYQPKDYVRRRHPTQPICLSNTQHN